MFKFLSDAVFGNWYASDFEVDGVKYRCGETYMMYHKALLMGDVEIAQQILNEPDPKKIKRLGQQVKVSFVFVF